MSVRSKDRVETNGRTGGRMDAIYCFTFPAYAVGKMSLVQLVQDVSIRGICSRKITAKQIYIN